MGTVRNLLRSFASGELAPEVWGRVDLGKYQSGLATCRNFIPLPHGPVINRAGTSFVRDTKYSGSKAARLIPFSYNNTQTFAIEVGAGYFRFHTLGATLESAPGVPYEVTNSYAEADLSDIHYVQSADVLTLVHPSYPVSELRRLGALSWSFTQPTFQAPTNVPTGVTATATGTGSESFQYVVTAVNKDNLEETIASTASTAITNDLTIAGQYNTVTWTAPVSGTIIRYNVYKLSYGLYGFIGQAGSTSFKDDNVIADVSKTPPINDTGFNDATGNYPAAVSYFEQRRCFGGTNNKPQNVWMTRSGTESNMSYTIPVVDDNRIAFRIAAREASAIRHIVPVTNLILLTASCEWRINPASSDALTPTSISIRPQSYIGANNVPPVVVGNAILFPQARGGHLREMSFNWQAQGYLTQDISLLAPHLFDYLTITDLAFARAPYPILWAVSSNGKLLGMTYVPEQQVASWSQHDTDGSFESICCVSEGNQDVLYAIVRRTINGVSKRYVECLHTREFATLADAYFVDCGATYTGTPATSITGLTWLEGKTVSILADGAVHPPRVVSGGAISLDVAASKVHVGLPITADIKTLPLAAQIDEGLGQGRPKNVNRLWLRCYRSSGLYAGPDVDHLTAYAQRTTEPYGSPPGLISDEIELFINPAWQSGAHVCVRQSDPLPLELLSMTMEVAIGG